VALLFDGTNDSLTATVDLSAVNKLTVAFWLYWDAYANDNDVCMEHTADEGAVAGGWAFFPNHSSGVWLIGMSGDVGNDVATFTRPSAAAWHQFTILLDRSAASHEIVDVYVDGTAVSLTYSADFNNTTNFVNSTLNFMSRNNTTFFGAGRMAEVALWPGIILDAGEAKALGKGFAPPLIRPTTLPYYWPMIGRDATVLERNRGADATINGAVQTDHPPVIYPSRAYIKADTAAPPPVVPGVFASGWAHSWVNPTGVAKPADLSTRQHTNFAIPPFDQLDSVAALRWLPSATIPQRAPSWPSAHIVRQAPTVPFYRGEINWLPVGGQQPQSSPRYPAPQLTPFIAPTDYAVFPHVPPWLLPLRVATRSFNYITAGKLVEIAPIPPDPITPPPDATVTCALMLGDLKGRVYEQLDDDGTYYTGNEVRHALNAAANLFAYLTLCKEKTASFSPNGGVCFHPVNLSLTDYIVPLRITTASGARIRPATIHELDGLSSSWRSVAGTPTRYIAMGYDIIGFTPQYAATTALRITYAATPTAMATDTDIADIPDEQQIHLVDYACWWLQLKIGGQELANAGDWLRRFVTAARKYGDFVRRRSYGQKYDAVPFDLASFDMGRLDIAVPKQPQRGGRR
jgi:hypothetical protein